jgi:hypothetical protein
MRTKLFFGAAAAALMAFGLAPASAQDADPPGDASTTARLDDAVESEFAPAGDVDWYRLSVEQGRRYSLALVGLEDAEGNAVDPMLAIYDAEGNQLAFNDDAEGSLNSALRYAPAQSGEVFVEARAFSDEATGRYRLGVSSEVLPPDDAGGDTSTSARISAGRAVTGHIDYEGDADWYRFSPREGYRYQVTLAGSGEDALNDPFLRVLDSDGNEITSNDDSEGSLNSSLEFIPQNNRTVYLEARAYADAGAGAYTLAVTGERLPPDDAGASASTRARVTIGQSVDSALDYQGDRDWYRVRLERGESYRFTLSSAGGDPVSDPLLRLYDARGTELAFDDDGGPGLDSYLEFTAPQNGNYYLEARSFDDLATGSYRLTANAGDIPADSSTDAGLSADGDYRESTLGVAGDRDWYRVDLAEGQSIRLALDSAQSADALADPYLVLYGPDGAELARDDDGGEGLNARLEYQAVAAGPHYVEARGFSDEATGRYALSLTAGEIGASADEADTIQANGDPRVSIIGAAGDADWFAIDLVEGRPYRFSVEGVDPDPLADPYLTLYNAQGEEIAHDDDGGAGLNAYLSFASPTGGTHFIGISSASDADTGRYQVRVVDTDVPGGIYTDEYLDASAGDDRASRIEMPGDIDSFRVSLEAGVRYVIDVRGAGDYPLADPFVALLNEEGTRIASDDDSGEGLDARLRFRPETSGDFIIQVSGLGGTVGGYQVVIARR